MVFFCLGMAQFYKVNILPQEVTAKYSNLQAEISGAKGKKRYGKNEGPHFSLTRRESSRIPCSLQEVLLP